MKNAQDLRVALVCMAKDEDAYIEEWINYHLKLGIDDIYIYQDDGWKCKITNKHVHLLYSPMPTNSKSILNSGIHRQAINYTNFKNLHGLKYDFSFIVDVDEFICIKKCNNIKTFLCAYLDVPAICFHWRMFGNNGLLNVKDENYSVINRFTRCTENLVSNIKTSYNFPLIKKIIGDDNFKKMTVQVHQFDYKELMFSVDKKTHIQMVNTISEQELQKEMKNALNIAYINHYYYKTFDEYYCKFVRNVKSLAEYIDKQKRFSIKQWHDIGCSDKFNKCEDLTVYNFMNCKI